MVGDQMLRLVTVEVKRKAPWVDVAIQETLYTMHAFLL